MTNMMIVDTTIAETMKIIEDKILKIVTESVQNAGHAYLIHSQESIQIAENVNDMKMTAHHCDVIKDVDASMKGSENHTHENHKDSLYRAKKANYGSLTYGRTYGRTRLSSLISSRNKQNSARDFVGLRHGTVITSPRRSVRAQI